MGLLFELPVALIALEARLDPALILDVVFKTLSSLVEATTAGTLVGSKERRHRVEGRRRGEGRVLGVEAREGGGESGRAR